MKCFANPKLGLDIFSFPFPYSESQEWTRLARSHFALMKKKKQVRKCLRGIWEFLIIIGLNPLSANLTKWSNTPK